MKQTFPLTTKTFLQTHQFSNENTDFDKETLDKRNWEKLMKKI